MRKKQWISSSMIKYLFIFLVFLSLSGFTQDEQINDFKVSIIPYPTYFEVIESIDYQFPRAHRRGIFREIITHETRQFKELGGKEVSHKIDIEVISVTDNYGQPYKWVRNSLDKGIQIKIGDANKPFVGGSKIYNIRYKVYGAIRFFEDHDEIYWNATGNFWRIPIIKSSFELSVPDEAKLLPEQNSAYIGSYGQSNQIELTTKDNIVSTRLDQQLNPREGLTVAILFEKGFFKESTKSEQLMRLIRLNWGLVLILMAPVFTLIFMFFHHLRHGKEKDFTSSIVVKYDAPEGLTPAEVGTLIDDVAHTSDVTSIILDLAVRGFFRISEVEKTKLFIFSGEDHQIEILPKPTTELKPFEKALYVKFKVLAKNKNEEGNRYLHLSDLHNKFYKTTEDIKRQLYASMVKKSKFYDSNPTRIRQKYNSGGAAVFLFILVLIVYGRSFGFVIEDSDAIIAGISGVICAIIVHLYGKYMPRKTRAGLKAYAHILGYKEFIERVEVQTLERLNRQDPHLFERTLPYAVAMGLSTQWAKKFKDIHIKPPTWYVGQSHFRHGRFSTLHFMRSFGSTVSTMESTITSAPRSSGSSSGGGGGGFSGGGSGGGGGGSW